MNAPPWKLINLLLLLWLLPAIKSYCQPTLPDITASNEKGVVVVLWTCQFDGVKSISVRRSSDSAFNYATIGYVKNLLKGVQAYADGYPLPGKNFYKLAIVFNSGLTWSSNYCSIYLDPATLKNRRTLPNSEALQKMLVPDNADAKPVKQATVVQPKKSIVQPKDVSRYMEVIPRKDTIPQKKLKLANTYTTEEPDALLDTAVSPATAEQTVKPEPPRPKIKLAIPDESATNTTTEVTSRYIFTDAATGNITFDLPGDITAHSYAVKFYDKDNHAIIEIPHVNAARLILDKRNFQKKGQFKFTIHKDSTELESGYITIY